MAERKSERDQYIRGIREILSILWNADKKLTLMLVTNNILRNVSWPFRALAVREIINCISRSAAEGFTGDIKRNMLLWLILFFIPFASNRIWWPLNSYVQSLMLARISNDIKARIMEVIRSASLSFFDVSENYNTLKTASEELSGRRPINIVNHILNFVTEIISLSLMVVPMFIINPLLTLILIASSIPKIMLENKFNKKIWQFEKDTALQKRKIDYVFNLFTSKKPAREIIQLGLSDYLVAKHDQELSDYQKSFIRLHKQKAVLDTPVWLILQVTFIFGYYIILHMTSKEQIALGDLAFFTTVVESIQRGAQSIGNAFNNTADSSRFINNIIKLYDNPYKDPVGGKELTKTVFYKGEELNIEFRNVSFKYPNATNYALRNISCKISLPEHIAIVGLNGSGKTTLIKLLLRFYDPQEGEILVNGFPLRELDIKQWRKLFSVCFQDHMHYGFSLRENISLSRLDAKDIEIQAAVESAGLSDVIKKLPNGLDTCLSKEFDINSTELSGGQKNRVALARAFLGSGRVIILDEPTASLDAKAEYELFNSVDKLEKDRLSIMITHRLSSTVTADKILVLDKGYLIEYGKHNELMNKRGVYHDIFQMQAMAYKEDVI